MAGDRNRLLFERALRWASEQPTEELPAHFAGAVAMLSIERRGQRAFDKMFQELMAHAATGQAAASVLDRVAVGWAQEIAKTKAARSRGGKAKAADDPKAGAMAEIRDEWERRNRPGSRFASEMAIKYQQRGIDISEGGIKNAIGRWRAEP